MIETLLLAFLVAKLRKYKLLPYFKSWSSYPILIMVSSYLVLQFLIFNRVYEIIQYQSLFKYSMIAIILLTALYHKIYTQAITASILIIIGSIMNKIAISSNGGKMPVFPTFSKITGYIEPAATSNWSKYDFHVIGDSSTKLKFLTDIFDTGYSIMSVGDLFVRAGFFVVVFYSIKHLNGIKKAQIL